MTGTVTPTITLETITPEAAEAMLGKLHPGQRNVRRAAVLEYAADMREGRWLLTGATLQFDTEGRLTDGRHRLTAVVESGATVLFYVARGMSTESYDVIDRGRPRSVADTLRTHGVPYATNVAACARLVLLWDNRPDIIWVGGTMPGATKTEVAEFAIKHHDLMMVAHSAEVGFTSKRSMLVPAPWSALAFAAARAIDPWEEFVDFAAAVISGENLSAGNPALTLRNRMMQPGDRKHGGWMTQQWLGTYVKAFNAYREGREVRILKFMRSELPMPVIA